VKRFGFLSGLIFLSLSIKGQAIHIGGNLSYYACYLLNKSISFNTSDSNYVFTGGISGGISGVLYFDQGGYYSRRIYGVNMEVNYSRLNQSYKIFPTETTPNPDRFYQYRYRLGFIDIPLLFSSCPSHHQGVTFEIGPQVSFLTSADAKVEESRVDPTPAIPFSKEQFRKVSYSAIIGLGCFYSFTENFALVGSFRGGYGLSDLTKSTGNSMLYNPTRRFWLGITVHAYLKLNKYDSKKNRGYKYYIKHR